MPYQGYPPGMPSGIRIRPALPADADVLTALSFALWPDASPQDHRKDIEAILRGTPRSCTPLSIFVAETEEVAPRVVAFLEVGVRSHADGCDARQPVGFLEGWYVDPAFQRRGVGRALLEAADQWARDRGCVEMASDTWLDAQHSVDAHVACGYEVVDRCVNFRKALGPPRLDDATAAVNLREVRRGDVFWIAPREGERSTAAHPHVVVQDDVFNRSRVETVLVCAITTNLNKGTEPGNVRLDAGEGGLAKASVVIVSQIDAVSRGRLGDRLGALASHRVDQVVAGLAFQQSLTGAVP